jgi:hypothetical protein
VRRVVQFSNGSGLPGYDTGHDGEGTVLGFGVDRAGKTFAAAGQTNNVVSCMRDGAKTSTVLTLSISSRKGTVAILRSVSVQGEFPVVAGDNRL